MYFNNLEWLLSRIFPNLEWSVRTSDKEIYLTFDDGPIPDVTDFVLSQLKLYNAKATFFSVGDNIRKYPDLFHKIIAEGHSVGNHTYNHLNGWKHVDYLYLENIKKCDSQMEIAGFSPVKKKLFRPPYGKIKRSQIKALKADYRIVMWNVLSGDYDSKLSGELCLSKAIKFTGPGSIVIFHDSIKAEKNLRYALPLFLEHFTNKGFKFVSL